MPLFTGSRLGVYEIVAEIGAGGMGVVYRARDTRLNRDVALKILPDVFAFDGDRLARFEREAQVLASLNHPNIAAIHGLEEAPPAGTGQAAVKALVLELVEGPTLADRIADGPIPLEEALPIVRQIADALEAAHDVGIVHRDLKPANIKLRPDGTVKVLDFGLAKVLEPAGAAVEATAAPTITSPAMTRVGVILGTAAYMAPEQARGKAVDRRADIWAFGCVLFEMLTGRRAFDAGETVSDAVAAILKNDPDWKALPPDTPPHIITLLRRCLQKDPQKRLPHVGLARIEIDDAIAAPLEQPSRTPGLSSQALRERLWRAAALSIAVAGGVVGLWSVRSTSPLTFEARLEINTPPGSAAYFAMSPDARHVVFQATTDGQTQLWLRSLDAEEARPIPGTTGAISPFWSPDSRAIGFFADQKLKRIDMAGGTGPRAR
ncbi:MAG: serine/threonine-protein kinase [Acidobacteria bacterium]|nr:serine/threonine-protein kinase [Acidobacteriota bacterium]